jgi:hypothetical protein
LEKNMRSKLIIAALAAMLAVGVVMIPRGPTPRPVETTAIPLVFRTPGGLLEVASVRSIEAFRRASTLRIAGINLGTNVSEVRVPATFRYQAALGPDWRAIESGGKLVIIAPAYHPALPVAIDTGQLEVHTRTGWARFDGRDNEEALLRELTADLEAKATSPGYLESHREQARTTVTEFVTKWLITQERWKAVRPGQVRVYFADEPMDRLRSL